MKKIFLPLILSLSIFVFFSATMMSFADKQKDENAQIPAFRLHCFSSVYVKENGFDLSSKGDVFLKKAKLGEAFVVLDETDIIYFDPEKIELRLQESGIAKLAKLRDSVKKENPKLDKGGLYHLGEDPSPFIVEVNGKRLFYGEFYMPLSSISKAHPVIYYDNYYKYLLHFRSGHGPLASDQTAFNENVAAMTEVFKDLDLVKKEQIFRGTASNSEWGPIFIRGSADPEIFFMDRNDWAGENWKDKYLGKTLTIKGTYFHATKGPSAGMSFLLDWEIIKVE